MYFDNFQVLNYKCFHEPAELDLSPGINIITGQNNTGKTALLEALGLAAPNAPHRSLATVPYFSAPVNPISAVNVSVRINNIELKTALLNQGDVRVPMPVPDSDLALSLGFTGPNNPNNDEARLRNWFFSLEDYRFRLTRNGNGQWNTAVIPSFTTYTAHRDGNDQVLYARYRISHNGDFLVQSSGMEWSASADLGIFVGHFCSSRVYAFRAERFNAGRYGFGSAEVLVPDASNLPEVLNNLQKNPARFERFNRAVREVLPQVKLVSVRPEGSNALQIIIWSHDPATERVDLAVPLNECGTGVGQVLAILYVVLNSELPQVIVIDEPQSFLHPGAARKLVEVLRTFTRHQFIITTHSPTIISAAQPTSISLIRQVDGRSTIDALNVAETEHLRVYLAEIGATLGDVFGADDVLWVEGSTEEICFPKILEQLAGRLLKGTVIKGVIATGDFDGKHANLVLNVYQRLSGAKSLLPPAIGFVFDDEGRSSSAKDDLRKRSPGKVHFTPFRMYENYLLEPLAITAVANAQPGFRDSPLEVDEVEQWISEKVTEASYFNPLAVQLVWQRHIRGEKLLKDLFAHFSDKRVRYTKPTHSVALTEWLLENKPEALADISDLLCRVLDGKAQAP